MRNLWWTESGEGWTRRLGSRDQEAEDGPWSKSLHWSWVMKALTRVKAKVEQVKTKCCERFVDS